MIGVAVSFIGGIAAFTFFPFLPFSIITLCILTAIFLLSRHNENKKKFFLIILVFVSGFFYSFIRLDTLPEIKLPSKLPDREVSLKGTVTDVPEVSGGKGKFTIDGVYIEGKYIHGKIRLSTLPEIFHPVRKPRGSFLSNGVNKNETPEYLLPAFGDKIIAIAKLKEPNAFHNPGVYSYDLKKDGIAAVGYIKQMQVTGGGSGLLAWIYKKRRRLGRIIDNSLSTGSASLHKAIIPGLKRGISRDIRDSFSSTGLAHLLSISGTHFGLLAFVIFQIVRATIKFMPVRILTKMTLYITPTQTAIVLTLPVLVLYALISGASTPTIRSFIMIFIYMLALFLGRRNQWLNSLSIAAIIILLYQPNALFELSFQLSFLAVLSIGLVLEKKAERKGQSSLQTTGGQAEHRPFLRSSTEGPPLSLAECPHSKSGVEGTQNTDYRQLIKKAFEKVKTAELITLAAVFGTAPLVAVYFKQFPLISPITNLIVTPLVCFIILPLGFFTGFIALLFNMSSMPLRGMTDAITHFALNLIKTFSTIPYSNLHVPNPSFAVIVLYFCSLMFIIIKSRLKWRFLPFIFVLCFYLVSPYLSGDNLRITFLDVGQGDASLVELPDKKVMLIDGGSYNPDAGRRVIAPYLWSNGIRRIDFMVLSHPHPDHYGGLIYIMDNFKVGEIWLNGKMLPEAGEFFQKIQEEKIPSKILRRGDVLEVRDYKIYVLHPYDEFYVDSPRRGFSNENSNSLVLKIESGNASALFTGDIETEAEENLIYLGKWLRSDIIKMPHHGGRTSSSEEFLKVVNPGTAVVSAGRNNPFNHPHIETLQRYKDAGVRLFRTDTDGAVTIILKNKSYEIKTYRDSRFKKVTVWQDEIRNLRLLF